MADTDLPGGFGDPRRPPRPIASPFGVMPTPGFNVVDPAAADQGPGLMANLWASLPSREDLKQGTAETLGAPVDMLGWLAHRMGLAVPGGSAPPEYAPSPGTTIQPWIPSADVPLSSRNIRGMIDNGPSLDALLLAGLRGVGYRAANASISGLRLLPGSTTFNGSATPHSQLGA
jgi:hypothetical protein